MYRNVNRISMRLATSVNSMFKLLRMTLIGVCLLPASGAHAADIVNGWSAVALVNKVHSEATATYFRLTGVTDSCGHPDFWKLAIGETAKDKAKLSMVLMAYASGKRVTLRCENSAVTDLEVMD